MILSRLDCHKFAPSKMIWNGVVRQFNAQLLYYNSIIIIDVLIIKFYCTSIDNFFIIMDIEIVCNKNYNIILLIHDSDLDNSQPHCITKNISIYL